MKIIGLIGGMSWESTVLYYQQINRTVNTQLGGLHSAKLLLFSVDFHEIDALQRSDDWKAAGALLADAARRLVAAGAEGIVLCTNTMHKVADAIEAAVRVPLLHIADPTAAAIKRAGLCKVGLLGTRFTMEQAFYLDRLSLTHGLEVIVPSSVDRALLHRIIYEELCLGKILEPSRAEFRRVIADLIEQGAEAIILGCTEIVLLIDQQDSSVPLFDTTTLHAQHAAMWALEPAGSANK